MHEKYSIRQLQYPRGVMEGADEATLIVRHSLIKKLSVDAVFELRNTYLGNDIVSRLDYLISCKNFNSVDAAQIILR